MDTTHLLIQETFSVNKRFAENKQLKSFLMGFCLFNFSYFTFGFHGFHLKKLKIIQLIFELARGRKFSGEQ